MELNLDSLLFFILGLLVASLTSLSNHLQFLPFFHPDNPSPSLSFDTSDDAPPVPASLREFSDDLKSVRKVLEILPGVHQARGYALGNSIMIEGSEGIVIVDTTESQAAAEEIFAEFRKISKKPVAAIVYTHFHADHITGTAAFIEDPANPPPIYSHETTEHFITQFLATPDLVVQRAFRQFGVMIPPKWRQSSGIGSVLKTDFKKGRKVVTSPILPTVTFKKNLDVTVAGDVELKLIHSPGETDDQIIVWLPNKKTLIPADNIYRAFPNLYAVRGNPARDPNKWIASIDQMISLEPEFLVPCHTNALAGKEEIARTLGDYRDGIQFVLDQTLRLMNKGIHLDDLQYMIQLPPNLKSHPYLLEHYGTVRWSVKGIFNLYMGWFSGYAEDLFPLPRIEKARRFLKLMGGAAKVIEAAEEAMSTSEKKLKESGQYSAFDSQMALELSSMILTSEEACQQTQKRAKTVRVAALKARAAEQTSPNGRNYYLTQALETNGLELKTNKEDGVRSARMSQIIGLMPKKVDPKKAEGVFGTLVLNFVDTEEVYVLTVRNCVVIQTPYDKASLPEGAVTLKLPDALFREILLGNKSLPWALAQGKAEIEGGSALQLASLLTIFES